MEGFTFLDANIFMYAAGAPHAYKDPCVCILADAETDKLTATVDTEIFQEESRHFSCDQRGQAFRPV